MKKISIIASLLLFLGLGLTGCKEDTEPRLSKPTEFELYKPAMADQTYIFRADETNKSLNDITFNCAQPNYGLGCIPDYQVQVAKSEADFAAWDAASKTGELADDNAILGADGLPLVYTLQPIFTTVNMTVSGDMFVEGVNAVYGLNEDNYSGQTKDVFVRLHAWIPGCDYSSIFSNLINIKVSSYIPVAAAGMIYMVGQPQGWNISESTIVLNETGIGTKTYYGIVTVPAGEFQFRFYSQLGDWDSYSIGAQDDDNPVDITFNADGVYEGPIFYSVEAGDKKGKGSWQDASWAGGKVEITVNLKEQTITMVKSEGKKIYVVGQPQGWDINSDSVYVVETEDGSNIYKGTIDIEADQFTFRFYSQLGDWEANSIGSQMDDSPINVTANGTPYEVVVGGKGSWTVPNWTGGKVNVTLNLNNNEVTFEKA